MRGGVMESSLCRQTKVPMNTRAQVLALHFFSLASILSLPTNLCKRLPSPFHFLLHGTMCTSGKEGSCFWPLFFSAIQIHDQNPDVVRTAPDICLPRQSPRQGVPIHSPSPSPSGASSLAALPPFSSLTTLRLALNPRLGHALPSSLPQNLAHLLVHKGNHILVRHDVPQSVRGQHQIPVPSPPALPPSLPPSLPMRQRK